MNTQQVNPPTSVQRAAVTDQQGPETDVTSGAQRTTVASVNLPGCDYCAQLVLYGSNEACPKCGTTGPLNMWPMAGHPKPQWDQPAPNSEETASSSRDGSPSPEQIEVPGIRPDHIIVKTSCDAGDFDDAQRALRAF